MIKAKSKKCKHWIQKVDKMLSEDIAKLMAMVPQEEVQARSEGKDHIAGGVFNAVMDQSSVFGHNRDRGVNAGKSKL